LACVCPASADEIRPVLLDIKEQNTGLYAITWKVPTHGDRVLTSAPQGAWRVLPDSIGSIAAFWTIQRVDPFIQGAEGLFKTSYDRSEHCAGNG